MIRNKMFVLSNFRTKKRSTTAVVKQSTQFCKLDPFNLGSEEDLAVAQKKTTKKPKLESVLWSRVASGSLRRQLPLSGEFYVELRVYNTTDAETQKADERWKKALVTLKVQLNDDSEQWAALQSFVQSSSSIFEEVEHTYYSDKIQFK